MEQLGVRQGHNPVPNSIPGCGIDSQRDFGFCFQLFLTGTMGTGLCTHLGAALGAGHGKKNKTATISPRKTPSQNQPGSNTGQWSV